jgi:hypothetical protein
MASRWIRILAPDWLCEVRGGCDTSAEWEEDRSPEQVRDRVLPLLRCERHLPSDAIKLEDEAEPEREAI